MQSENNDKLIQELYQLVDAACDDVLSETQISRLNQLLDEHEWLRCQYLRYIAIHSSLSSTAGHQAFQGLATLREEMLATGKNNPSSTARRRWRRYANVPLLQAAAAILLFVPTLIYFVDLGSARRPDQLRRPRPATGFNPSLEFAEVSPLNSSLAESQHVRVNRVSEDAGWQDPNERLTVDSSISTGGVIKLSQGELELTYETGVQLLLMGPSEFVVREAGGELRRGSLVASVPEAGQGFTISTPNGKVVDLGTEFGVVVDDFGISEVSVYKGKVEAFPKQLQSPQEPKYELTKGHALQWSNQTIRSLSADPRRLPLLLASVTESRTYDTPPVSIPDQDQQSPPSEQAWITLGHVEKVGTGYEMHGENGQARRPYLLTAREYDPTDGPVTVVCDIRFPHADVGDEHSFAILTRSENEKSAIDRPWNDILATCVRCNFHSVPGTDEGLLETATKFERDRELTGISWRGFRRPQANTLYRLIMRDDGVNVSFTVSEVNNPSVTKTVVCRSIFRGYKNHVALEGWSEGTVIVENVRIVQSTTAEATPRVFARFTTETPSEPNMSLVQRRNDLLDLVPDSALLRLEDRFDGPSLDPELWQTLGEVSFEDGSVSLGETSVSEHINTFHPRPYLLTRKDYFPQQGKLYILGRIEFAENYLQGYGGSFAVMTRCNRHYGDGPGWAISALGVGVRGNLWPASPQRDHILEIHEKPTPNTLAFLQGASLNIEPQSRVYFFCMEDDGKRAAVTFQDALHPVNRRTISFDATSSVLRSGAIAFESCWGSKVLLDEVQIFVQQGSSNAAIDP